MPVFDPTRTADKVAETLPAGVLNASGHSPDSDVWDGRFQTKGFIDARRRGRPGEVLPPELDVIKQQREVRVHIFNVGPFAHIIPCGSAGTFYIPACPPDKDYVEMLTPLYGVQTEVYPKTRNSEPKRLYDDGKRMAVELLGEGRNQHKRNSKRRVGVFIAVDDTPTKKEVDEARAQMHVYAQEQVAFMDNLWDRDRKLAYDVYRPETFGACAQFLGLTGKEKPWLAQGEQTTNVKCEYCKTSVDPSAAICLNCKMPVNEDAYLKMKTRQAELDALNAPTPDKKGK
jgi:hypothetical protein